MRHADSENFWRVKDHERPITEEGRQSAFKVWQNQDSIVACIWLQQLLLFQVCSSMTC